MNSLFITVLAFLIGGGGSDLLDYVSPAAYWKEKQVTVSVDAMARELKPPAPVDLAKLIDSLSSPDPQAREGAMKKIVAMGTAAIPPLREAMQSASPQVAVSAKSLIARIEAADRPASLRRLMAIRELGELKNKDAIAVLEPLLKSDELFVADYARQSIDQINGQPVRRHLGVDLRQDVWLLPDGCRMVGQLLSPNSGPISLEAAMKDAPLPPGQDRATVEAGVQNMLVSAAENLGNIRLDALSFGISGDIGDQKGYVVAIARGRYDSRAVIEWMHKQQIPANLVGGVEIFQPPGAESAIFFPSNEYAVGIASPAGADLPIQEVLDAIKTHQGKLNAVAGMKKLIEGAPADQPLWAVAAITPAFAKGVVLAPFQTVQLNSRQTEQGLQVTIAGTGTDAAQTKAAVDMANNGARQAAEQMKQIQQFMPALKAVGDAMASVKCEANGANATLNMKVDGARSGLFLLPLLMSTRAEAQVNVQPAPPAPLPNK
jgi:hypothetical protein